MTNAILNILFLSEIIIRNHVLGACGDDEKFFKFIKYLNSFVYFPCI